MKISIIVPIYNVEIYLEKCINSILNQTLSDFELIMVNDGSTDRSGEICDKYGMIDSRIKIIHKKNGGLSSARNAGLDVARGEYIGFVDSDDYIDKQMYEKMIEKSIKSNSDIVICDMKYNLNGKDISQTQFKDFGIMNRNEALIKYFNHRYFKSHAQNKIYKKELFNNIRFPEGKLFEDVAVFYKLLYKSRRISFINEKLYIYNQGNSNSITKKCINNKHFDLIDNALEIVQFFIKNNESQELFNASSEMYFISVKTFFEMLYSSKKNMSSIEFKNMQKLLIKKINNDIYIRGLIYYKKERKCNIIIYESYKLKNIIYLYNIIDRVNNIKRIIKFCIKSIGRVEKRYLSNQ